MYGTYVTGLLRQSNALAAVVFKAQITLQEEPPSHSYDPGTKSPKKSRISSAVVPENKTGRLRIVRIYLACQ